MTRDKRTSNARRQKAAIKRRERSERVRKSKIKQAEREAALTAARKNWPPLDKFPPEDHMFWVAHGINYLVSNDEEGLWTPMFPEIYEGKQVSPEQVVQATLERDTEEQPELIAWSAQPRETIWLLRERCKARIKSDVKDISKDEIETKLRAPHNPSVWSVFMDLKISLQAKRLARAGAEDDPPAAFVPPKLRGLRQRDLESGPL